MCGRFLIEIDDKDLASIVEAAERNIRDRSSQSVFNGGEIYPGSVAPVITADGDAQFMTWGFPPLKTGSRPHINVRSETAITAPTFGEAMASRRCLVPAAGYYEWKTLDKKSKQKYMFTLPDRAPLYMAGIYSGDGRFAILTRAATPAVADIHDRMPVIVPKALSAAWLMETSDVLKDALTDLEFTPVPSGNGPPEQFSLFV